MAIAENILGLIGATPMVRLRNIEKKYNLQARLLAKLEFMNPAGSAKDRIAREMIQQAISDGQLAPGGTVIEPTSGNTGIGIAAICASIGLKAIIVMPDSMSIERQKLMRAYGARLVLTPGRQGMQGAVEEARRLQAAIPGSIVAGQFKNPANPEAHYKTTGPEIWRDAGGKIDALVAGIGSGGTISGAGRYLKEKNPEIRIIGVEPAESPLISRGSSATHGIQGIGANFIPENLDRRIPDEIICVSTADSLALGREIAAHEGLLCGISSGAALAAAIEIAGRPEFAGKSIALILPDTGERYLSSAMFE